MRYKKGTQDNPDLVKHEGCDGCFIKCSHNGFVARPDVAKLSNGILFGCNPQNQIKELIRQS